MRDHYKVYIPTIMIMVLIYTYIFTLHSLDTKCICSACVNILCVTLVPNTTINGSYPNVLVGQTVKLFCYITLLESVTVSENINYTVDWSHGQERVYQSSAVGSLVHTYMIVNASLSDSGEYTCAVHVSKPADVSEPPDLFNLSVFSG